MKKTIFLLLCSVLISACIGEQPTHAQTKFPQYKGYVNDFENILSDEEESALNEVILSFGKKTSNEIAIVTLDSMYDYKEIRNLAKDLFNEWRIGKNGKDNGLLILVSAKHRSDAICTGTGTSKILTDEVCKTVRETKMVPQYKSGKYYEGLMQGLDELIIQWEKK